MRKEYSRNKKIAIYGSACVIKTAEAILDTLDGLENQTHGFRLINEGEIRIIIQNAIDTHKIKASILVDGNSVYPLKSTIKQYEQLMKSGTLENMTEAFYKFLHLNFDIAHYSRNGYIAYYNNNFAVMKKTMLDKATTPGWKTDVRRILDHIQGRNGTNIA